MSRSYNRSVFRCESDEQRKELKKVSAKRHYEKNKEKYKERNRLYYLKNKEKRKAQRGLKKEEDQDDPAL